MAYDMLDAINNGKDSWKVKVRVIRLWDAINLNNNELISLDMILLDEHGTMIHAKLKATRLLTSCTQQKFKRLRDLKISE
uniref:Replication protein A 70 kDa DNA-binding subunit B/D first OB fold domain-containing protein n=1 Tax=Aegilops tauschii subsp. strangulata TaxID=200361 RepID=A0A453C8P0_AEGTS